MKVLAIGGISLVAAAATLPHNPFSQEPGVQRADAVLELRLGALDGPAALGRVEAIEVDHLGRLYLLESDEQRVRVFSPEGESLRTLGRRGSGPGEFRNPVGMDWAPDGTLWVVDPGNARVTIYDTTGQHLTDRHLASGFELAPWPGRFDRGGNFYHYTTTEGHDDFTFVMVKYDLQLNATDTIAPPLAPEPMQVFESRTDRWGIVRARVPFTPSVIWRLAANGRIWWAWSGRYEVVVGGNPIALRERSRVRVSQAEREDALAGLSRFRRVGGRVDPSRLPDFKPLMRSFFVDDEDQLWVMPELADGETGRLLEVYHTNGGHLQDVTLPVRLAATPQPVFQNRHIYGIERDEFDVAYLVVLRIDE